VRVSLDAFNPMIPGNVDDSSLPTAIFHWRLENRSERPLNALLVALLSNLVGYPFSPWPHDPAWAGGEQVNTALHEQGFQGVLMGSEHDAGSHPAAGTMALITPWQDTIIQTRLGAQDWGYSLRPFWYQLLGHVPFTPVEEPTVGSPGATLTVARRLEATLAMQIALEPGEAATIPVIVTWHFPNRYVDLPGMHTQRWVGNHYSTRYSDATDVARYVIDERERLEAQTRQFHDHLFGTTVPNAVIDAVSANMSTIRSQTCFRDQSGQFYAYEGCNDDSGCCPMNCTHVWMYEQALASLYPELERGMRANALLTETEDDGRMHFRTRTPQDAEAFFTEAHATADGQMAEIIQLLREYQMSGDREFLARLWPKARLALEYAWRPGGWDADQDGVMEGEQHNTTDIAYYGPNPFMNFLYLAALHAGAAIAGELGDPDTAASYTALALQGAQRGHDLLWNGEFYQQRLDLSPTSDSYTAGRGQGGLGDTVAPSGALATGADSKPADHEPYNQVHGGCLTDQLFGQWLANLVGVGPLVSPEHIRVALRAVYHHNFKRMDEVPTNFMRAFAVNDEMGVLFATYPQEPGGIIPLTAVFRAHEVWSGCEYQVACHMIQEGMIAEGESIVEAIRARHDGAVRNPWNEPECGDHYARAMASFGLLQAYARSHIDLSRGRISLAPQISRTQFQTFFSVEGAWGTIAFGTDYLQVELGIGELDVRELVVDGQEVHFSTQHPVTPNQPLRIQL
jgi:uncharacterized protein (DUF608 family)